MGRRLTRLCGLPIGITARVGGDTAVFNDDDRGGYAVDELTVVRNQEEGAIHVGQLFFQELQRFHVKVVGGFVHNQEVAGIEEEARQEQTGTFATAEGFNRRAGAFGCEEEVAQITIDVLAHPTDGHELFAFSHILNHRRFQVQCGAQLVKEGGFYIATELLRTRLWRQLAQEKFEQRGLARTIFAQDTDAFATQNTQRDIL